MVSSRICESRAPDLRAPRKLGRNVFSYDEAGTVLDDLELRPDVAGIGTQEQPTRDEWQRIGQAAQNAELPGHVVGAGRQLAEWWPA